MKETVSVKQLCLNGLFMALVCLFTMVIQIPVPATSGYIHPGDGMIIIIAVMFGKKYGFIAGGFGSALADLFSGYPHWIIFTFITKGLMGYAIGVIADYNKGHKNVFSARNTIAAFVGVAIMVTGYLIGGAILKGSFIVSLASVPENIIQGVGGAIIYYIVGTALQKVNITRLIDKID